MGYDGFPHGYRVDEGPVVDGVSQLEIFADSGTGLLIGQLFQRTGEFRILDVTVLEAERNRGIGTALLQTARSFAWSSGWRVATVTATFPSEMHLFVVGVFDSETIYDNHGRSADKQDFQSQSPVADSADSDVLYLRYPI